MPKPPANGNGNGHLPARAGNAHSASDDRGTPGGTGLGALIEEAQALKQALHDGYGRITRLLAALKRHRKQSKLMASTLAGLRQLQRLHPGED